MSVRDDLECFEVSDINKKFKDSKVSYFWMVQIPHQQM